MTALHLVRQSKVQRKGQKTGAKAKGVQPGPVVYPPGWITEPVRAWKQLQWQPATPEGGK
jgi:hypothetical protein